MGLRYRKQISILPGIKLNISKSGFSTSIGKPGNTLNISNRGVRSTVGIPGTGLSYSQMLGKRKSRSRRGISRQEAQLLRADLNQKFGLTNRQIDRLIKLSKKKPRKFMSMSEQELIDYAQKSTVGSRFFKFILWIVLIALILKFLASFS